MRDLESVQDVSAMAALLVHNREQKRKHYYQYFIFIANACGVGAGAPQMAFDMQRLSHGATPM